LSNIKTTKSFATVDHKKASCKKEEESKKGLSGKEAVKRGMGERE